MESVKLDRQRGQILVTVALMAVAIFAFVALAVDIGQIYGGRRRMQNAADAGALAGAREICFGGYTAWSDAHISARAEAHLYAERNGADEVEVSFVPDDYTVHVVAGQTLDTFFAGVIGIRTADVGAEARARCGGTVSAGGIWPLAFKQSVYTDTEQIPCDEPFMVFSSSDDQGPDLNCAPDYCYGEDGNELSEDQCGSDQYPDCDYEVCSDNKCNCPAIGIHWDTDDRGWLRFPDAGPNRPDACKANDNCGAEALKCYIQYDHPGPIEEETCLPGNPGTNASVKQAVEERINHVLRVPLWDEEPCTVPDGWCPGDPYHIVDFGCVEILSWEQAYKLSTWGSNATCRTFHAISARKICEEDSGWEDCSAEDAIGSGLPSEEWELRTVTLIE